MMCITIRQRMTVWGLVVLLLGLNQFLWAARPLLRSAVVKTAAAAQPIAAEKVASEDAPSLTLINHIGGPALAVAVQGQYAYLGSAYELTVLDVTDPFYPTRVNYHLLPVHDLVRAGDRLWVAGSTGLTSFDLAEPRLPHVSSFFPLPNAAHLAIAPPYAYIAEETGALHVLNIADPAHPVEVVTRVVAAVIADLAIADHYLYLASDAGLDIIAIADPTHPVQVGLFVTPLPAQSVTVADHLIYVSSDDRLLTIDGTDPAHLQRLSDLQLPGSAQQLLWAEPFLYVAGGSTGLYLVESRDPAHPFLYALAASDVVATALVLHGNYLYTADGQGGLRVIYAKDPAHPSEAGAYRVPGLVWDTVVAGQTAYVVSDYGGTQTSLLSVLDMADAANVSVVNNYSLTGKAYHLLLSADCLYIPAWQSGLHRLMVTPDGQLEPLPFTPIPQFLHDLASISDTLYLVGAADTVAIIDTVAMSKGMQTTVLPPAKAMTWSTRIWDLTVAGEYAFAAAAMRGLQVVKVHNPLAPTVAATLDTPGYAQGIAVAGDYVYIADSKSGLQVINIVDPTAPYTVGAVNTGDDGQHVVIQGHYAFVAAGLSGLYVIDIAVPNQPAIVAHFDTPGYALAVTVVGEQLFVADYTGGLLILRLTT